MATAEGQSQGGTFFVKVDEAVLRKRFFVSHDESIPYSCAQGGHGSSCAFFGLMNQLTNWAAPESIASVTRKQHSPKFKEKMLKSVGIAVQGASHPDHVPAPWPRSAAPYDGIHADVSLIHKARELPIANQAAISSRHWHS